MRTPADLRQVLRTYKVLLDTSFAMDEGFSGFCEKFEDTLRSNPILMPLTCKKELAKLARDSDKGKRLAAECATQAIGKLATEGMLEFRHESCDSFTDLVIQRVVEQHLLQFDFCVLTNDVGLMRDLYAKRQKRSVKVTRDVVVIKLYGKTHEPVHFRPYKTATPPTTVKGPQPFALVSNLARDIDVPLDVKHDVAGGSDLYTSAGKKIKVDREIARGGEGAVFDISDKQDVCKIYHRDRLTVGRENKISLMSTRRLDRPGVCWPLDVLRDSDGVFRGFVMPRGRGHSLRETLFVPKLFLQDYPDWTRRESVKLAITILETIDHLHRLNVLIGDINELNILMVDESEVYFVDCDSYQAEGYPCSVGTVNFTAPEIRGRDFSTFLRTKEHELFAVASLLFMVFHPGKCPYSHQGGEDGAANIREGHFPYPLGKENPTDRAPLGHWRFCWSHLCYDLKEAFYRSFDKDHLSARRVSLEEWLQVLGKYQQYLSDDEKVFIGPSRQPGFDLSILPQNFRRRPDTPEPQWQRDLARNYDTDLESLTDRIWLRDNTRRQPRRAGRSVGVPAPVGTTRPRQSARRRLRTPSRINWRRLGRPVLYLLVILGVVWLVLAVLSSIPTWWWVVGALILLWLMRRR